MTPFYASIYLELSLRIVGFFIGEYMEFLLGTIFGALLTLGCILAARAFTNE